MGRVYFIAGLLAPIAYMMYYGVKVAQETGL